MTTHCIFLRPDIRPDGRSWGRTPVLYNDKVIGSSDQPEYDAARWLLANNAAHPDDRLETYRGSLLCMSGVVGELAKWTVVESEHGHPTFSLRRWRPFPTGTVGPRTAETLIPGLPPHPGSEAG
jgi:hypothetical protein